MYIPIKISNIDALTQWEWTRYNWKTKSSYIHTIQSIKKGFDCKQIFKGLCELWIIKPHKTISQDRLQFNK